jgi:hypothetical protein
MIGEVPQPGQVKQGAGRLVAVKQAKLLVHGGACAG